MSAAAASRASSIGAYGLPYAVVPALVLPLAALAAATPYLWILPLGYLALSALLDEWLPQRLNPPAPVKPIWGNFWLALFGVNLLWFTGAAAVAVAPQSMLAAWLGAASTPATPWPAWRYAALVFALGLMFGLTYNVAHDLIHRATERGKWLYGFLLLAFVADSQLSLSHIYGHHPNVGTPLDPATARRGESLYAFLLRSTVGQYREAWQFEVKRLRRERKSPLSLSNRILSGAAATLVVVVLITIGFGVSAFACYAGACLLGKYLFEASNYIQHYGLVRVPGVRVEPRHSWDSPAAATRLFMFNQNNHSNHHLRAARRCWELEAEPQAPRMPLGYVGMIAVAGIPPLWFRLMDRRVGEWLAHSASPAEIDAATGVRRR